MTKGFTNLTGHLLLYSKGHYGRTSDVVADLRKFMCQWSGTPEEYYTSTEIYRIVAHSFVEACEKQQIRELLEGLYNPIKLFYVDKKYGDALSIAEIIASMVGLMSMVQIRDGDELLVELPEKNPEYMVVSENLREG